MVELRVAAWQILFQFEVSSYFTFWRQHMLCVHFDFEM